MIDPNSIYVQTFIFATGIIGQFYVSHMNRAGFYWWIASNAALIWTSYHFQSYGQLSLYLFFSAMCFYSLWKWRVMQDQETFSHLNWIHISEDTNKLMDDVEENMAPLLTRDYKSNAMVILTPKKLDFSSIMMPNDMRAIVEYAQKNKHSLVRISPDGGIVGELCKYD